MRRLTEAPPAARVARRGSPGASGDLVPPAHLRLILAGELLCAAQGIHTLRPLRSSPRLEAALDALRKIVPPLTEDRRPDRDLERLDGRIRSGAGAHAAEVPKS